MARTLTNRPARASAGAIRRVAFDRRKYGRELLVDVGWVHELRGFLFDEPHALGFFDVILVTRGDGWFSLDGHRHRVRPGAVFFTTPGQVRRWEGDATRLDGICLFFEELFIREFLQDDQFVRRLPYFHADPARAALALSPGAARGLRARLVAMRRELARSRADGVDLLRAKLHEALVVLARQYASAHRVPAQRATHRVVSRFQELVERDASHRHRIADYAAELAVTPGHLSVLCEQYAGRRAKRLLADALTSRARRLLLHTDESAARIAAALGFDDASYFARFFRRETGETPTAFRRTARGQSIA